MLSLENNKKMVFKKQGKKAQVTVFVIIAILIVIVLIFLFMNRKSIIDIFARQSPIDQIEKCIKESAQEGLEILSPQGGSLDPENYYMYQGNKVEYVCYTEENFKRCIMQKPLLKQSVEKELKKHIESEVDACLESVKSSLEKNYKISYKEPEIDADIIPNNIVIGLDVELEISNGRTDTYKSIKTSVDSGLYEFIMIESSIANWEARYGDSETMLYMLNYPKLKVEKKTQGDGTRIYILTNRDTGEKFMFAVRSMVLPPGLVQVRK